MKRYFCITLVAIIFSSFYACKKDYLNVRDINTDVTMDELYAKYSYVQQAVWHIYSYLPNGFPDELNMEAATDNAEATNPGANSQDFNNGIWNQYNNPYDVWDHYFEGIREANLYLENKDKVDISYIKGRIVSTDSTEYFNAQNNVKFMRGEVLFLKAFFYFELVKRYGGVPILDQSLDFHHPNTYEDIPRNSLDECIQYIADLCDSSAAIIPQNLSSYSWYEDGRVTYGAIMALKSRLFLYAASPLYTNNGSSITWADAAKAAHDVIQLGKYQLDASYSNLFNEQNASSKEFIFYRRYGNTNNVEFDNYPIGFQDADGSSITPTENFVEQFEILDYDNNNNLTGSHYFDINNPQDVVNPYLNRDPRFYATVVYNGDIFSSKQIETYNGGSSGLPITDATKTGYYLAKWVNQAVDLVNNTQTVHTWCYFRYGEILLNYAEAMYNAYGATSDPKAYGMTALDAINKIRDRVGMPDLSASELNQKSIEHERNVEMGFENQRFWDVRRWEEGTTYFNKPVTRMEITKNGSDFRYETKTLEKRVFEKKMDWFPIPENEINKTGWTQNPDW